MHTVTAKGNEAFSPPQKLAMKAIEVKGNTYHSGLDTVRAFKDEFLPIAVVMGGEKRMDHQMSD